MLVSAETFDSIIPGTGSVELALTCRTGWEGGNVLLCHMRGPCPLPDLFTFLSGSLVCVANAGGELAGIFGAAAWALIGGAAAWSGVGTATLVAHLCG